MDFKEIAHSYLPKFREHFLPIMLGLLGFILLSYSLIQSLRSSGSGQEDITFESAQTSNEKSSQKIVVDIEGGVSNPGVYTLESSSRIKDILIMAGGFSSEADRVWVEKNINLASKLSDGAKIYIPRVGDPSSLRSSGQAGFVFSSNLININSASTSELDTLPGVGPATSQKIIDGRPYGAIEELLSKKIVGSKTFERIKDKITAY